ncbi:hypothetical protein FRX31_014662 [Thalictrum thalictroides]|uniref:Uncharacterized protein n=1 Tax=Thalictrum thalictroides TaxID=46969 RepID=A0A7J6WEH1_THATH|nr:hypothetical protein FRX31_014662 [Thalictrum thalictroides]
MESHVTKLISAEEVISKLKDDGDFDKLRLKIIKKVKENEELRNNIIATVKQSAALNRAGAEKFKPRELSDAIHEEIGMNLASPIPSIAGVYQALVLSVVIILPHDKLIALYRE